SPDVYADTTSVETLELDSDRLLLRIVSGRPTVKDLVKLMRLAARHPETSPATPPFVEPTMTFDLRQLGIERFDVLAGSGLSYDSNLPMLKAAHDLFFVADGYEGFCLGDRDPLPGAFGASFSSLLKRWAGWHVAAARAEPSVAHTAIAELRMLGVVDRIFTD